MSPGESPRQRRLPGYWRVSEIGILQKLTNGQVSIMTTYGTVKLKCSLTMFGKINCFKINLGHYVIYVTSQIGLQTIQPNLYLLLNLF